MPSKTTVAIVALTLIVGGAMCRNIDGALIATVCTLIAGLGGYAAGKRKSS